MPHTVQTTSFRSPVTESILLIVVIVVLFLPLARLDDVCISLLGRSVNGFILLLLVLVLLLYLRNVEKDEDDADAGGDKAL